MFKLSEKNEVIGIILICDYTRYAPSQINTINTANSHNYINILRKGSVNSLLNRHLDLSFDVIHAVFSNRHADGNDKGLVNIGPFVLLVNKN